MNSLATKNMQKPRRESEATYMRRRITAGAIGLTAVFGGGLAALSEIRSSEAASDKARTTLVKELSKPVSQVQQEIVSGQINKDQVVTVTLPTNGVSAPREAAKVDPDSYSGYTAQQDDTKILEAQAGGVVDLPAGKYILPASEAPDANRQ